MNQTLHVRFNHRLLRTGIRALVPLSLALGCWLLTKTDARKDPDFTLVMKFFVAGVALCAILMSCAVVEVWRRFVEIDPARIVAQGAFRRREMRWEDVEEAVWHLPPPGCVVLSGPVQRMWILFRGFDRDEARLLRGAIRIALPAAAHREKWIEPRTQFDRELDRVFPPVQEGGAAPASTTPVVFEPNHFIAAPMTRWAIAQKVGYNFLPLAVSALLLLPFLLNKEAPFTFVPVLLIFGTLIASSGLIGLFEQLTHSLEIHADRIIRHQAKSKKELAWNDVRNVVWRARGEPKVELIGSRESISIKLKTYAPQRQLDLIRLLRDGLPHSMQVGWALFCAVVALPLRDPPPKLPAPPVPGPGEYLNTRRRVDFWMAIFVLVVIGVIGCLY
jgi:hypothetical protein